ncbi:hypothetical protein F5I97DRAFT_1975945 [Phlebopus sp. FC_14]|nr:hypothetical protein F5I97DRAFT_1975945 [Phlebopus sp. FC_14]
MVSPNISTLKVATADLVRQAREDGTLSKLTVRIVRRELEKKFALDEGVLDDKEYRTVIKETIVLGLDSNKPEHGKELPKPSSPERKAAKKETSRLQKSTVKSSGKNEGRKRKSKLAIKSESSDEHAESEAPGQESEDSADEDLTPKKKSRIKTSKEKPEKISKSKKPKKPQNDKVKSVAIIESSADEDESEERKPAPSRSPKKELKTTSPKCQHRSSSPSKNPKKEEQTEHGLETDVDMSGHDGPGPSNSKARNSNNDPADSELSSVVDEAPKKHRKKNAVKEPKPENGKRGKKTKEPLSKDEDTVVRLKAMVVACGVRKTWKKEFGEMDRPSQQIKRLHEILGELGMTPRYSMEKAKVIREKRELAQELKDVQEFDQATRRRDRKKERSDTEESAEYSGSGTDDVPTKKKKSARASIMAFLQDQSDEE